MVATSGITYKMFKSLAEEKINILAISTSEIKVSVIIGEESKFEGVREKFLNLGLEKKHQN